MFPWAGTEQRLRNPEGKTMGQSIGSPGDHPWSVKTASRYFRKQNKETLTLISPVWATGELLGGMELNKRLTKIQSGGTVVHAWRSIENHINMELCALGVMVAELSLHS